MYTPIYICIQLYTYIYAYIFVYICIYIYICLQDTGMKKRVYRAQLRASLLFVTGWRRPIGYLKIHVIFRKRTTNYSALWRKITCKDKASNDSTPTCAKLLTVMRNISRCVCGGATGETSLCYSLQSSSQNSVSRAILRAILNRLILTSDFSF